MKLCATRLGSVLTASTTGTLALTTMLAGSKKFVPHRMLISVHYYTPWQFAGMTKDESWGKVQSTWGSTRDVAELNHLFDAMQEFCKRNDLPAVIGEFGVTDQKETPSRVRWMLAVAQAALSRAMVPVLWDTGGDISRKPPHAPSVALSEVLGKL